MPSAQYTPFREVVVSHPTNLQMLGKLRRATGMRITVRPFETVVKVEVKAHTAAVLIDTYVVDERPREFRFKKHGLKLVSFYRTTVGWVQAGQPFTDWDDEFEPFSQAKFGRSVSPQEYVARRAWERNVFRPGSDITPLDSYQRVLDGPTHPDMERYW